MFEGFEQRQITTSGTTINLVKGGSGPGLLLLHGYPQMHAMWHKIAPRLAQDFTVVAADLRGYGDSGKPHGDPAHLTYAKRAMAQDQVEVMQQLGFETFNVVGHDRGARVSHRMCLDHPERVMKVSILDMLPTYHTWTNTSREWALGTWHWSFLAQPEPFPQTMINAVGGAWFLTNRGNIPRQRPKLVMDEFIRCFTPKSISGACRDYRAGATIGFEMDAADKDKQITTPLMVLWGTRGAPPTDEFPTVWRRYARNLVSIEPLATGHYIQEEMPEQCLERFFRFFVA